MKSLFIVGALAFAPLVAADGLRDPMRPPLAPSPSHASVAREAAPVLSAIIGTADARIAIFNGQLVRAGGAVGAYVIEAVFEDGVRYRHAGLTQELYLPRVNRFKQPSTAPARLPAGVH